MLGVSCLVVVLAFLLRVLPEERVAFRGLERFPLPPSCALRFWFGVKCPGCGLTRSIVQIRHANPKASLRTHRLGWLMAVVILIQIPYRALALSRLDRPILGPRTATVLSSLLIVLLVGNWIVDMLMQSSP